MAFEFDTALGIHPRALVLRARRNEVLAANIANADTPGYKARDIDFRAVLGQAREKLPLVTTRGDHFPGLDAPGADAGLRYRVPNQPSLDGNTVDPDLEKAAFAENALRYNASLTFLDRKFRGLITAIKGE